MAFSSQESEVFWEKKNLRVRLPGNAFLCYDKKANRKGNKHEDSGSISRRRSAADHPATETVTMHAGEFRIISLGVSMQLPEGYEAHIVPRSSTFRKWGILQANSMGVIDESYCGDDDVWGFPALAMRDTTIARGDRICQFRVMRKMDKPELVTVERLDNASRGGFGSTGTR